MRRSLQFPAKCIACALTLGFVHAMDWPQWRGPDRTGHVPQGEPALAKLSATPNVVWRMPVGEALASPVVAQGKLVYFDAQSGKETLHVIDALTTNRLWSAVIDDTFRDNQGPAGPRCTPVIDGDRVYALSAKGELQCRNFADGALIWRANFTNDFSAFFTGERGRTPGAARHGNNGSPLIDGDRLYAQVGGTNGESVVCFNKRTGQVQWKSQNDMAGYAPPVMAVIAGVKQVICFTADGLIGLRESDGNLLWRVPLQTAFGRHAATPIVFGDIVVVASHQIGLVATRIKREGPELKAEPAWINKALMINFSSPVLVGKHLYGLGPTRNLVCVDLTDGNLAWSKEGYFSTSADKSYAGFVVIQNNILTLTDGGELVLFEASPAEFKELGRAQVCGLNWCNPAYANGKLYLRDGIGTKGAGQMLCVDLAGK